METSGIRHPSVDLLVRFGETLRESAAALHAFARHLDAWLAVRKRAADDREVLTGMSERELRDIGISRASIHAIAANAWARDVPD